MFQRLEKMKKNALPLRFFSERTTTLVSQVSGCGRVRTLHSTSARTGPSIPEATTGRSSPKAEETKALVAQYWKWEGNDLEGRKFNQGKISSKSPSPSWRSAHNIQLHSPESLRLSSCAPSMTTDNNLGNKSLLGSKK